MCRPPAVLRNLSAVVIGAVASVLAVAAPASATVLWSTEQTMVANNYLRYTFIYDVGAGHTISYEQFAAPDVASFYERHGFDANFMYWAPIVAIDRPADHWMACRDNHGGLCSDANVVPGNQPIVDEIGSGQIHVKLWNGAFIGTACGNWNRAGSGPVPRIGGVKYEDLNGDGARAPGEPGLAGWTIELRYNGILVATTATGSDGSYQFSLNADSMPIGAGTFTVSEAPQPGWVQSQGAAPVTVGYGVGDAFFGGHDFGNYRPASISGRKFEDMNADGSGSGEPGLADWPITYTGRSSGSTATAANGTYRISGLPPGTYTIGEQEQAGWNQSLPGGAGSYTMTVRSGDDIAGIDFGNWRPATIQGRKFDDHGVDGSATGDPGLPGWGITLNGGAVTTTDADGAFAFTQLRPGTYTVGEQQQSGWRQTAPQGGSTTVTLTSGQVLTGVDIGNVCLGTISVTAPGGVSVRVDEQSVPGILTNDPPTPRLAAGTATISALLPGVYRVTLTLPDGIFTTDPDLTSIDGAFVIVKSVNVAECTTSVVAPPFVTSQPGKITGGVRILVPGGFATAGFEFMQRNDGPRGTVEFNDHASGARIHTSDITGISVSGTDAYIFGHVVIGPTTYSFRLHLVDAGEPGTEDHFELLVSNGYSAGSGETLDGGNIQIH